MGGGEIFSGENPPSGFLPTINQFTEEDEDAMESPKNLINQGYEEFEEESKGKSTFRTAGTAMGTS